MSSSSSSTESDIHLNLVLAPPVPHQRRRSSSSSTSSAAAASSSSNNPVLPHPILQINLDLNLPPPPPLALLHPPFNNEQWDIIKTLTDSDVGGHSRLLIPKNKAILILNRLSIEEQRQVYSDGGLRVKVLDIDMNREVFLKFRVMASNQSHVLNGKWMSGFVNARDLKKGYVIGLRYWRQPRDGEGMILFKVLTRAV